MVNQNKNLKLKVKLYTKEIDEKSKQIKLLTEEVKELKTQMFTYQRLNREHKENKDQLFSELEQVKETLKLEMRKRERIEK